MDIIGIGMTICQLLFIALTMIAIPSGPVLFVEMAVLTFWVYLSHEVYEDEKLAEERKRKEQEARE